MTAATPSHNVKIAYLILAHRYPEQLFRLINRLEDENVYFFIHVDKKVDDAVYQCITGGLSGKPNVFFIKRYTCYWAGFGIMQATLQGIKEIVESKLEVDYISLMSGQDYPIKSNAYIQQFLKINFGRSFVWHRPFPDSDWETENGGFDRVRKWHFVRRYGRHTYPGENIFGGGRTRILNPIWNKVYRFLPALERKFPMGMHPYGGAQFWCLYKKHYKYVYDFIHQHPAYVRFFRYVFVSDEILVQSIIGNSNFTQEVQNDTLHFLEWLRPGATLYTSDRENILKTYHLFARKFDATVDANILDVIDREILYADKARTSALH